MRSAARVFLFASLLVFVSAVSHATPSPATWERVVFLGSNAEQYFVLAVHRDWPPSHYAYSDTILLRKHDFDGMVVERVELRNVDYENPADRLPGWSAKYKGESKVGLADYLAANGVFLAFPEEPGRFRIEERKLVRISRDRKKKTLVADTEHILSFFGRKSIEEWEKLRLLAEYRDKQNDYFLMELGDFCCRDMEAVQAIVVVTKKKEPKKADPKEKE